MQITQLHKSELDDLIFNIIIHIQKRINGLSNLELQFIKLNYSF